MDCGTANQITYTYGNDLRVTRTKRSETTYYVHASSGDLLLEFTCKDQHSISQATSDHLILTG